MNYVPCTEHKFNFSVYDFYVNIHIDVHFCCKSVFSFID